MESCCLFQELLYVYKEQNLEGQSSRKSKVFACCQCGFDPHLRGLPSHLKVISEHKIRSIP